jgi:iron(III) transport system ATP-binding protein
MTPLLEAEAVEKRYAAHQVLAGVNLRISRCEHLLVTGPSGCGKSTLLHLIAGLEAPDGGLLRISGSIVSAKSEVTLPPHRRELAMVFQDLALWPNLSVLGNVLLGLSSVNATSSEKRTIAHAALEACEIATLAAKRPVQLSGGEQQRVALARALAVRPKLLLLDEPFNGVDLILRTALLQHIRKLADEAEATVLLVSHNPADARLLSARVAVLEDGVICEEGTLEELKLSSRSRTMAAWQKEFH